MPSSLVLTVAAFALLQFTHAAVPVSKSSRCGARFGLTCQGSTFGNCCSNQNYCGSSTAYCGTGCQSGYGSCTASPAPVAKVSKDGSCGGSLGYTCSGSAYGDCCSQHGYCGSTSAYCGAGCKTPFGQCSSSQASSSRSSTMSTSTTRAQTSTSSTRTAVSVAPSSTLTVTTNSRCGKGFGFTCQGSKWGDCCSQYSFW